MIYPVFYNNTLSIRYHVSRMVVDPGMLFEISGISAFLLFYKGVKYNADALIIRRKRVSKVPEI